MWGRFSNLASMVTGQDEGDGDENASGTSVVGEVEKVSDPNDLQLQVMEQERMILQLKEMIRERDKTLGEKETQLKKVASDLSKHKLQSKSKIKSLTSRLDESQKATGDSLETASVCSDESTSTLASEASSVVAEQTSRARTLVLKRRLKEKDQKLAEKDAVIRQKQLELEAKERVLAERDTAANDVSVQLTEQTNLVEHLRAIIRENADGADTADLTTKKQLESRLEEMISQMVHKDGKILDLMNQLTDKDKAIMDLQEHISEKDEVIRGRDQAIGVLKSLQSQKLSGEQSEDSSQKLIAELTNKLASEDKEIQSLKEELAKMHSDVIEREKHREATEEVMKMLEKKLLDAEDLVSVRSKESEQLRIELVKREGSLLDATEQLSTTLREVEQRKETEQQWFSERSQLLRNQRNSDDEVERERLSDSLKRLEASYGLLSEEHLKLRQSYDSNVETLEAVRRERELESKEVEERVMLRDKEIEELKQKLEQASGAASSDSKFAKFKALAGSKIKALEKQVEELKQHSDLTDEVASLRNHVAELEDEKGNFQLQILELEETVAKQASEQQMQNLEALQSKYNDLQETNNSQKNMIEELKMVIDELKRKELKHSSSAAQAKGETEALVSELRLEIENLKLATDSKQNECLMLMSKLQEVNTEHDEEKAYLIKSIQELNEQNAVLNDSLEKANKQIEEQNSMLTKLESENSSIIDSLKAKEEKFANQIRCLDESSVEIQRLNEELRELQRKVNEAEEKETEFVAKTDTLLAKDVEIQSLQAAVHDATEQISIFKVKQAEYLAETDSSRSKDLEIQDLNDKIRHLTDQLVNYEAVGEESARQSEINQDRENEISLLNQKIINMSEQLLNYERKIEEMTEIEKQIQEDNESLKSAIHQKDEDMQKVTVKLNSSVEEIQELKSRVVVDTQSQDEVLAKLKKLEEDLEERGYLISNLEAAASERENELAQIAKAFQMAEDSLERLKEENKTLRVDIQEKELDIQKLAVDLEESQLFHKQQNEKVSILERSLLEKDEEVNKTSSDGEILQVEIESLTSKLRESEDLVQVLEKKTMDGDRKIESLAQNLEEEEMQLVSVTEELEQLKTSLAEGQTSEQSLLKQLMQKDEEMKLLSDMLQEKETQSKKYLAIIKKMKQKQQSDVMLQRQNDLFTSELQLCKDELNEKNVEVTKMQRSLEEFQLTLNETTEELERLRPVAEELKEMMVRCQDLTEEVRISKSEQDLLSQDLAASQSSLGQKEMLLSNIQSELNVGCDEDILSSISVMLEQERTLRSAFLEQKQLIETKETEMISILHHREELSQRILDLEREVSMRNKELQVLGSSREDLSFQLGQSEQEKLCITEELSSCQVQLSNKDSLISKLKAELERVQSDISESKSHESLSSAEIESLRQQNSSLSETLTKLKEENFGLTSSVEQANMENFHLANKLDAATEQLSKLKDEMRSDTVDSDEVNSLRLQLSEVENLTEQLNEKLRIFAIEKETVVKENLLLTSSLEQLKLEADQKKNVIADQDVELDALSSRLQTLTSENNELKKELEGALSNSSDSKLEQSRVLLEKSHLESSVAQLNLDIQKLVEENCQLKLSNDSLSAKLEDVQMEKLEVSSQLSRLTARGLESEAFIKEKEIQAGLIEELQFEVESLRRSSVEDSGPRKDAEQMKLRCSELDKKCDELCFQLETSAAENKALIEKLSKSNEKHQLAENQARQLELEVLSYRKEHDELLHRLEEEKIGLESEAVKLRERAVKAEAAVQQLLTNSEFERQRFAKVESELQGTAEELELLVARLTTKVEMLEERNEKQQTDGQLKINELLLQLDTCQEEKRLAEFTMKSEKESWKEREMNFISDLEQLRLERLESEKEMQRKSSESMEHYDMLSGDIRHYQDLVDQLKAKNVALEQSISNSKDTEIVETENHMLRKQLEELNELRLENSSLTEEIERLNFQVKGLTETHDEVDDVMSRLFLSMNENEALQKKLNEQKSLAEENARMVSELAEINDKHADALKTNSTLILQVEELYSLIKAYKDEEVEIALMKDRYQKLQKDYNALAESYSSLQLELQVNTTDNRSLKELLERQEMELSQSSQLREERLVTKAAPLYYERPLPQMTPDDPDLDDDTPKIHASASNFDVKKLLNEREMECRQLNSKVDGLVSQKEQLMSHLQQRESELANMHQQFQLLYQQYGILQQHYTALAAEQQKDLSVSSTEHSVAVHPQTQLHSQDPSPNTSTVLSKKLEDSERLCKELAEETSRLEQHLELEKEKRLRLEDSIGRLQEQIRLHELSTDDSHTITMVEPEEERKMFRSKLSTALRLNRNQCPDVQKWFDGCSILLGRVLRGQPQVRKAFMMYIVALHIYVIFGCLLAML